LSPADALALVEDASERIWTPEGTGALAYLRGRGLTDPTIRQARLGWTPGVAIPIRDGARFWRVAGITIPWMDGARLALVKIRRPEGCEPRYAEAFHDRPRIFPGPEVIQLGAPLVITEGEFDALLLGQELEGLAAVVTLGSASARPEAAILGAMLAAPTWYVATDGDDAGDKAASKWLDTRARRVRPPGPGKDWGDVHRAGFNRIRYLWGGILRRPGTPGDELAPGIVIDRPARGPMVAAVDDPEERAGILEFDGGLSRDAAERAAGLRAKD
jgi:hypothetical protein